MTRILLLRHAEHDWLGRGIAGRMPDVRLNERGRVQAQELVGVLAHEGIDAIVSSPQPLTRETVEPLAKARGLDVAIDEDFDEVDFGDWTGWTFERLQREAPQRWRHWCDRRGSAQPPGGEPFGAVALRAMAGLQRQRELRPHGCVLVASHGDVIRAALATILRMSLDDLELFEVEPASTSIVELSEGWARVKRVNG